MSRKLLKIWFDEKDHMIDYANSWCKDSATEVVGEDFEDTFTFLRVDAGGTGAPKLVFTRGNTGRMYYMFLDSFAEVLHLNKLHDNKISAKFRYEKRGYSQGFKLLLDNEQKEELERIKEASWRD